MQKADIGTHYYFPDTLDPAAVFLGNVPDNRGLRPALKKSSIKYVMTHFRGRSHHVHEWPIKTNCYGKAIYSSSAILPEIVDS